MLNKLTVIKENARSKQCSASKCLYTPPNHTYHQIPHQWKGDIIINYLQTLKSLLPAKYIYEYELEIKHVEGKL